MTDDLSIPSFLDRTGDAPSEEQHADARRGWRDHLKVHPAADLFPLMSEAELRELGEDIKANGLRASIVLYKGKLLDGRNRLDAMELVGVKFGFMHGTDSATKNKLFYLHACDGPDIFNSEAAVIDHFGGMSDVDPGADPYAFVLSANLHRRHLTSEQKRELIAKVLKAKPEASNRTVAKQVRAHHTTVGTVRAEMEQLAKLASWIRRPARMARSGRSLRRSGRSKLTKSAPPAAAKSLQLKIRRLLTVRYSRPNPKTAIQFGMLGARPNQNIGASSLH